MICKETDRIVWDRMLTGRGPVGIRCLKKTGDMRTYFEETAAGKAFFELLRAGLWGQAPEAVLFEQLRPEDWKQILGMAQKQAVLGLVYAGVARLPKSLMPGQQAVLRLYGLAEQIRKKNREIAVVTQEVCGWFETAGLEPIVLKGQAVGTYYTEPDLRQPGDLDLFFHRDYDRVVPIVEAKGIKVELDEHHDKFYYLGILVELHRRPFHLMQPAGEMDFSPECDQEKGFPHRVLNLKANAVLLLLHPAVHFMEAGLGLRQLCDWAVWIHRYAGQSALDEAWLFVQAQGIGRFACEFTVLAERYLGVEREMVKVWTMDFRPMLSQRMLHEILEQGNFGSWKIPKSGDWMGMIAYGVKKMNYAFRVYPFCPVWFWRRFPIRLKKLWRRMI